MSGSVRIIGGEFRRRLLKFPDATGLRPTPDRVRETLFNWLGQDLSGLACLDLFAGSGALGFEAASRGAAKAVLVERDAKVAAALRENAKILGAGALEVVSADALQFASATAQRFDVVFLDPPYGQGLLERVTPMLSRLVKDDALVYAEAEKPLSALGDWAVIRHGRAGQVCYHLLSQDATHAR
jgi:16S rRNA (guanine966-N2)-methyltransferase